MADDRVSFAQLSAYAARLERRVAQLQRELEERDAGHADRDRQVQSWRRMWHDIGREGSAAVQGYRTTATTAQSGLYSQEATKTNALDALDEVVKAAGPLLDVAGKLGKPFS